MDRSTLLVLLRLLFAALVGAAIGWNRFRAGKPAGIGTHSLVALGAALFVIIPPQRGGDVTRVVQGVVMGVGFLGAGEIFRDSSAANRVYGLASASALWVTAGLGLVSALGSVTVGLAGTGLVLVVLTFAHKVERRLRPPGPDQLDRQ